MLRRDFIKVSLSSLIFLKYSDTLLSYPSAVDTIKPSVLEEGDLVGIIAPATAVSDPDEIARAKETLDYFGLKMKLGDSVASGGGYKTRGVKERLNDLHGMFRDSDVKAIFCIRGGYGSGQLLDKIDYELIKENPKIFLGYSDITAMHLAINKKAGLVTFHGPVALSSFSRFTVEYFQKALFSSEPLGLLSNPEGVSGIRLRKPTRTIRSGNSKGILRGGNLSLICSLLGTPYEIETEGKIVFLEDVGEQPYRIDRMLNHLRLSGKLDKAAGIVFGECSSCDFKSSSRIWDYSLGEVLDYYLKDLGVPVFYGLTIGHTRDQLTLPMGVEAMLDADAGTLSITEAATKD